jgi:hypothetical protein
MSHTISHIVSWRRLAGLAGAAAVTAALVTSTTPAMAAAKAPVTPPPANAAARLSGPSAVTAASAGVTPLASQDGVCDVGDVCLYYFATTRGVGVGSGYDTAHNDSYLFDNHFISSGFGQGAVVGNNAEAVWNRDPRTTVWVCTGTNSTGTCGFVGPNVFGNLTSTFSNKVQSLTWADSTN